MATAIASYTKQTKDFICGICRRSFFTGQRLSSHVSQHYSNSKVDRNDPDNRAILSVFMTQERRLEATVFWLSVMKDKQVADISEKRFRCPCCGVMFSWQGMKYHFTPFRKLHEAIDNCQNCLVTLEKENYKH